MSWNARGWKHRKQLRTGNGGAVASGGGRIYVMKSTASYNKAMLINQASMPVCIDSRQEDLFSIYDSNMA